MRTFLIFLLSVSVCVNANLSDEKLFHHEIGIESTFRISGEYAWFPFPMAGVRYRYYFTSSHASRFFVGLGTNFYLASPDLMLSYFEFGVRYKRPESKWNPTISLRNGYLYEPRSGGRSILYNTEISILPEALSYQTKKSNNISFLNPRFNFLISGNGSGYVMVWEITLFNYAVRF